MIAEEPTKSNRIELSDTQLRELYRRVLLQPPGWTGPSQDDSRGDQRRLHDPIPLDPAFLIGAVFPLRSEDVVVTDDRNLLAHLAYATSDERESANVSRRCFQGLSLSASVGIALAQRMQSGDAITLAFIESGTLDSGDVHEGLNFAAVAKVPLLLVVRSSKEASGRNSASRRFKAYGIPSQKLRGDDIMGACFAVGEGAAFVRSGGGPYMLEIIHATSDQVLKDGDPETAGNEAFEVDSIARFGRFLAQNGIMGEEEQLELGRSLQENPGSDSKWKDAGEAPLESTHRGVFATSAGSHSVEDA